MKLFNKNTNKLITNKLIFAKSLIDASIGLLNRQEGTAMMFQTRWGIHTFFMKYPIDVLVLDRNMKVVSIKKKLQPNRVFFWIPTFSQIIELPSTQKYQVQIGDLLKIQY